MGIRNHTINELLLASSHVPWDGSLYLRAVIQQPGTPHPGLKDPRPGSGLPIFWTAGSIQLYSHTSVSNLVVFLHPNLWRVSLGASSISGYSFISQPAAALTSSPPDSALSMWEFQSKSPVMKNLNAGFLMKQDQYQSSWEPDKLVPIRWALCSAFISPERDPCWELSFCTLAMVWCLLLHWLVGANP